MTNDTTKEKGDINQAVFDKACRIAHAAPGFCDAWEVYHDLMAKQAPVTIRIYADWIERERNKMTARVADIAEARMKATQAIANYSSRLEQLLEADDDARAALLETSEQARQQYNKTELIEERSAFLLKTLQNFEAQIKGDFEQLETRLSEIDNTKANNS